MPAYLTILLNNVNDHWCGDGLVEFGEYITKKTVGDVRINCANYIETSLRWSPLFFVKFVVKGTFRAVDVNV